ncbi:MAG: hypothetical protein H6953_15010 [Chromatiaceae bacterium]|nr:hypothetical protein [Chromatiaceae bacterium]MCP5421746.1 hypothetical protein [Chromatiaceae bacterium]
MPRKLFNLVEVKEWKEMPLEQVLAKNLLNEIAVIETRFSSEEAKYLAREFLSGGVWAAGTEAQATAAIRAIKHCGGVATAREMEGSWE